MSEVPLHAGMRAYRGTSLSFVQGYHVLEMDHPFEDPPVRGCTRGGSPEPSEGAREGGASKGACEGGA